MRGPTLVACWAEPWPYTTIKLACQPPSFIYKTVIIVIACMLDMANVIVSSLVRFRDSCARTQDVFATKLAKLCAELGRLHFTHSIREQPWHRCVRSRRHHLVPVPAISRISGHGTADDSLMAPSPGPARPLCFALNVRTTWAISSANAPPSLAW